MNERLIFIALIGLGLFSYPFLSAIAMDESRSRFLLMANSIFVLWLALVFVVNRLVKRK